MNSNPHVRVGLIGCGQIGPTHAAALAIDGRARLVAACDLDPARLACVAPEARHETDWRRLVDDEDIDLVIVATPHHLHAEMACAVLSAGKHLWLEKPVATTPTDVARILAAARASGRVAAGVFQHRHTPLVARLQALLERMHFGPVRQVDLSFRCTRSAAYYASGDWRGRWATEGGALLINQGIHHIDLAQWFAGRPRRVSGWVARRTLSCIECEDAALLSVECDGGVCLSVDVANDASADWSGTLKVSCRDGGFTLDLSDRLLQIDHPSCALVTEVRALASSDPDAFPLPGKADYGRSHARQATDVITSILAGRQPLVRVEDAAVATNLVLAAYQATASGSPAALGDCVGFCRPTLV